VPRGIFSPDSALAAVVGSREQILLVSVGAVNVLAALEPRDTMEEPAYRHLAFSTDACKLVAVTRGNSIHVWNLRLIREELEQLGLAQELPRFGSTQERPPPPGPAAVSLVGTEPLEALQPKLWRYPPADPLVVEQINRRLKTYRGEGTSTGDADSGKTE
jgi:hypothetical protein